MNLYNLHKNPKSLEHHDEAHDKVAHLFWDKYRYDPGELKKREKALALSTEYAYKYAKDVLRGRFELGEPAIAKDAIKSYFYAKNILGGEFKLGEPEIKTDRFYWSEYQKMINGKSSL